MGLLTRDQFLVADGLKSEEFFVAPLKGNVRIKSICATDKDIFEQKSKSKDGCIENIRAWLVAMSVVDENDKQIFHLEDIEKIGKMSSATIDLIVERIQKLNKITDAELEEAIKNSEGIPETSSDGE